MENADLRNCPRCGRLFRRLGRNLCPACIEEDDRLFERVREYLAEHRQAGVDEIAQALGVVHGRILALVREGRLLFESGESGGAHPTCALCGAPLEAGRICPRCAGQLARPAPPGAAARPAPASGRPGDSPASGASGEVRGTGLYWSERRRKP